MKSRVLTVVSILTLWSAGAAFAADEYNDVPAGDTQYAACMKYSMNKYEGGEISSPIHGQTKAQAWCTCMWNETPDNFRGDLAKFSETDKGAKMNAVCEKYSNWGN